MNGIRQGRVEPPADVKAAYRLASSCIRIDESMTAAGSSELVANAFVTKATNKDSKKVTGYCKKSGGEEKSPRKRELISVIHAVKLAIGLRIAHMETTLRS